jgi:hypothetical protein
MTTVSQTLLTLAINYRPESFITSVIEENRRWWGGLVWVEGYIQQYWTGYKLLKTASFVNVGVYPWQAFPA